MENSGVLFYKHDDSKIPVMFVNDCVEILNGKRTINRIINGETKDVKLDNMAQKNSLYLMYQGTSYLIYD